MPTKSKIPNPIQIRPIPKHTHFCANPTAHIKQGAHKTPTIASIAPVHPIDRTILPATIKQLNKRIIKVPANGIAIGEAQIPIK